MKAWEIGVKEYYATETDADTAAKGPPKDLIEKFLPKEGFMNRCMNSSISSKDKEAFCTWLYKTQFDEEPATKSDDAEEASTKGVLPKNIADSLEVRRDTVAYAARVELEGTRVEDGTRLNLDPLHTFEDAIVMRDYKSGNLYEVPYVRQAGKVFLGDPVEVQNMYVQTRLTDVGVNPAAKGLVECELAGPIVMKNSAKRIAYGAVLVPDELDSDGESVNKAQIELAAHEWMQNYRNVDLQHTLNNVAVPVESYILPADLDVDYNGKSYTLPQGSWILATKVLDDKTWDAVEKFLLTGYSVMGIRRTTLASAHKSAEPMALKRTLLRDLGPDWVAVAVSLVDEPAVPKAKFFAIKSREQEVVERVEETWFEKVRRFFTGDTGHEAVKTEINEEEEVTEMKPEEFKALIDEAVNSAISPLREKITGLEAQFGAMSTEEPATEEAATEVPEEVTEEVAEASDSELDSFKAQVMERLEAIEKASKRSTAASKSLKGQDGGEEVATATKASGRDAFGRKREVN